MRSQASILHLDLDAFFAAVEQRDKPSLRGKPVVVGGIGGRGVVATASYEARRFGVRSAMSTREARSLCPHAAYLGGRFGAYREASSQVMTLLRTVSLAVEPLSLDEAFLDLAQADPQQLEQVGMSPINDFESPTLTRFAHDLRSRLSEITGGLTASVGIGSSKFIAKIATELDKPDGLTIVPPGSEQDLLRPMQATVIPGVGPATSERLRRAGYQTILDLEHATEPELITVVGNAAGRSLFRLCRAQDDRPVERDREAKSVSSEGTYETDLTDRRLMEGLLARQAREVGERLRKHGNSGRTVSIKVRLHDFTTLSRSLTLPSPTDDGKAIARASARLLADVDTSGGVRLLGVGVSGLADWVQDDLFDSDASAADDPDSTEQTEATGSGELDANDSASAAAVAAAAERRGPKWTPGMDIEHAEMGPGWVWGSGRGVVTVRFETADTPPGPVRSYRDDDPELRPRLLPAKPEDQIDT